MADASPNATVGPHTSYHYPADLFELLVEVIPLLCKAKLSVIDFFRGAGLPASLMDSWDDSLRREPQQVRKAHISRDILRRVNEGGERMLAHRREILKRVVDFEDFTTCWEDDRYKAEALVNRVRQLVNVKDSFTRMTRVAEQDRSRRQADHLASVEAIRQSAEVRTKARSDLYALFGMSNPQMRGKALEGVLNRLFASYGIPTREAFNVATANGKAIAEQIDGVVEIDAHLYLVEVKWLNTPVGTEPGQHASRVMTRPPDVRALYVSASGFTEPAIQIAREFLSHRLCVLMELKEVVECFDRDLDLLEVLRAKIHRAQTHKEVLFRVG